MENVQLLGLVALAGIFVRFLTLVRGQDWDGSLKQIIAWAAGIGAVVLYAHTGQADGLVVGGTPLSLMGGADQALLGLSVASVAGLVHVGFKAFDGTQSARQPDLVAPRDGADV